MKRVFRTSLTVRLWAVMVLSLFAVSCSNDAFFGFNEECGEYQMHVSYITPNKYNEHLSLHSYNYDEWTLSDLYTISQAEDRMCIEFFEGRYFVRVESAELINVSDSLYNMIKDEYEYTNFLINGGKRMKVSRVRSSNPEDSSSYPNCVPIALTHIKSNAPSYSEAEAACDRADPNWRTHEGVYSMYVEGIINQFTNVYKVTPSTICFSEYKDLDQCVLLISKSDHNDHAVNAIYYDYGLFNNPRIEYKDFKAQKRGRIRISEMTALYPYISISND